MFNRGGLRQSVNAANLSTLETKIELNQNSRFDPNLTAGTFHVIVWGKKNQLRYTQFWTFITLIKKRESTLYSLMRQTLDSKWRTLKNTALHHYSHWFPWMACRIAMQDIHCNLYSDFCPPSKMQLKSHLCRKKNISFLFGYVDWLKRGEKKKRKSFSSTKSF